MIIITGIKTTYLLPLIIIIITTIKEKGEFLMQALLKMIGKSSIWWDVWKGSIAHSFWSLVLSRTQMIFRRQKTFFLSWVLRNCLCKVKNASSVWNSPLAVEWGSPVYPWHHLQAFWGHFFLKQLLFSISIPNVYLTPFSSVLRTNKSWGS